MKNSILFSGGGGGGGYQGGDRGGRGGGGRGGRGGSGRDGDWLCPNPRLALFLTFANFFIFLVLNF